VFSWSGCIILVLHADCHVGLHMIWWRCEWWARETTEKAILWSNVDGKLKSPATYNFKV